MYTYKIAKSLNKKSKYCAKFLLLDGETDLVDGLLEVIETNDIFQRFNIGNEFAEPHS